MMNKMKKPMPTREEAQDYIYEYGWYQAALLLKITDNQLDSIIYGEETDWKKPNINENASVDYVNPVISEYVAKNYDMLYNKFVKNIDTNIFYQNDEDIFHTALIKLCSEPFNPSEATILKKFDKLYKATKYRTQMNYNQMKRKEMNYSENGLLNEEENLNE